MPLCVETQPPGEAHGEFDEVAVDSPGIKKGQHEAGLFC